MQKKLKPFDLEAALNGAAVVTREGKEVTEVVVLKNKFYGKNVLALINNNLYSFYQDGKVDEDVEYPNDLFMKPQQVTKWVNIYEDGSGYFIGKLMSLTKEDATGRISELDKYVDTIQITFKV